MVKFLKKYIKLFIIINLLFLGNITFAQELAAVQPVKEQPAVEQNLTPLISQDLEKEIKTNLEVVYGSKNVNEIYSNIEQMAKKAVKDRPKKLLEEDKTRTSDWYKDEIIYMFYVDQFGVVTPEKPNSFKDSIKMLDYLKDLGVTTIYILPFADSPMGDSGFDVKNPQNVREDLGGISEFKEFVLAAKDKGFKIKADLVLNHFSDQHQWFQDAMNGDIEKLNYFIVKDKMPEYKKYVDEKKGTIIEYKEANGKISRRRLIFPEITDNHYRKVSIKNKDYYLYHTFYPFQLDINWENPKVLYYCLDTISYWANLGIDIFRMDAIPYFVKEEGSTAENLDKTHDIVKIISSYLQATAPRSVIQAEACQTPKNILPYFGKERTVTTNVADTKKTLTRTDEIQIAYHFPYMPALWASFITEDNKYFVDANKATPEIPQSASWATFLRVHDELTLEMVDPSVRKLIYDELEPKGAEFRKGLGVSGRVANFLDNNTDRILMAYSTLLSLPGIPIIYYGDEIAAQNNYSYAKNEAKKREKNQKKNKIKLLSFFDSRDINRGSLSYEAFYSAMNGNKRLSAKSKVYKNIKHMVELRKANPALSRGSFTILKTKSPKDFAYIREYNGEKYLIVHNLGSTRRVAEIDLPVGIVFNPNKRDAVYLENILNGEIYKLKVSLTQKTTRLLMYPYATLWLKLF
ncbi:MAG: alpha-amylase family glycosyl hydrolase [Candidatus Gastranaerophilales bacterium]|nr:alpha-amylase family glycosyl hydrolase [Candidatus Gastranaerophilales bacterium]